MKVALNYYGQPRALDHCLNIFNKYFKSIDELYILYTSYNNQCEDKINRFREMMPSAFIRTYPDEIHQVENDVAMDRSNPNKTVEYYYKGLWIKQCSAQTILEYEIANNILFDVIITLRCDTNITCDNNLIAGILNDVIVGDHETVYAASEERFNIYGTGSVPDTLLISTRDIGLRILFQYDNREYIYVANTKWYHPETSAYNNIIKCGGNVTYLNMTAFPISGWINTNGAYAPVI